LARETIDKRTTQKLESKAAIPKNHGNKDMYPSIHWQFLESRDIQRQEIEIFASKAAEPKYISKATIS
jgi:hypothetical protein